MENYQLTDISQGFHLLSNYGLPTVPDTENHDFHYFDGVRPGR
ncbi:MAG: hypothetical protein JWQ75_3745 [Pseudarthrobacter sp.]|nr:hypothetical protein [Pseudarthrobacter sp.]